MMNLKLTEAERQLVCQAYTKSRDNTLAHDIGYVAKLNPAIFDRLLSSNEPRVQRLGRYAILMQRFIGDCQNGAFDAPSRVVHAFTAVLLYLVNPFDVIPDSDSDRGFADDVTVLELGLTDGGETLRAYATAQGIDLP